VSDAETTADGVSEGVGVGESVGEVSEGVDIGESAGRGVSVASDAPLAPRLTESIRPERNSGLHSQGAHPLFDQISNAHSVFLTGSIQSW
jgi:hypothetical protein